MKRKQLLKKLPDQDVLFFHHLKNFCLLPLESRNHLSAYKKSYLSVILKPVLLIYAKYFRVT